jgi:hypothetical protein
MGRSVKVIVAGSLLVAAGAAGAWAWFLRSRPQEQWEMWSSVLGGFAALLAVPALVATILALRGSRAGGQRGSTVVRGGVRAGRDAYIAETQSFDQRGGGGAG